MHLKGSECTFIGNNHQVIKCIKELLTLTAKFTMSVLKQFNVCVKNYTNEVLKSKLYYFNMNNNGSNILYPILREDKLM